MGYFTYRFAFVLSTGKVARMMNDSMSAIAEQVVAATISELPPQVRERIAAVPVLIEDVPSAEDLASGIDADTLGFFDEDLLGLATIRLWIANIAAFADDEGVDFRDEVRTTLLHEIGHVLGWDEEDLDERGLG
ncbi:MAG: metallopeptidase family protein [Terrimicrobiaceae bacterium]|jgi:predicted Zn-dependent protease with MMP-like domain